MDAETARRTAVNLREVLAQVDAGEVEATARQRAYLAGAVDALEELLTDTSG